MEYVGIFALAMLFHTISLIITLVGVREYGIEVEANPIARFFIKYKIPWVLTLIMIMALSTFYIIVYPFFPGLVFNVGLVVLTVYLFVMVNDSIMFVRCWRSDDRRRVKSPLKVEFKIPLLAKADIKDQGYAYLVILCMYVR